METLLIEEWTGDAECVVVLDEGSLSVVRERVRAVGAESGVAQALVDRAVLVASELGRNQLRHAFSGRIMVTPIARGTHRGIEITAVDRGSGLVDVASALDRNRPARTEGSLGVGVGSVRRLSSEVDFDIRVGEGTRVKARLLPDDAPRRREVGVYGRPHEDEKVSGDHAAFCRVAESDALVLVVCDGLGHGPAAREASHAAMKGVYARFRETPAGILASASSSLGATRGVVMCVARIDEASSTLEGVSVGNIELSVSAPRVTRRFGGSSAVLGARGAQPKPRSESSTLAPNDIVVMNTDGISSKLTIEEDLALLREHPVVIAQRIMERFGRSNDDALVLVAR